MLFSNCKALQRNGAHGHSARLRVPTATGLAVAIWKFSEGLDELHPLNEL